MTPIRLRSWASQMWTRSRHLPRHVTEVSGVYVPGLSIGEQHMLQDAIVRIARVYYGIRFEAQGKALLEGS